MNPPTDNRILAIDWLRGMSVLVMIECHAMWLLNPIHDQDRVKQFLQYYNGLPSCAFIFAAGFSLALISGRVSSDPIKQRARMWKSLRRIGEVFLVSIFLREHFWQAVTLHHERLLWPDVLALIAYSLLLIWAVLYMIPYGWFCSTYTALRARQITLGLMFAGLLFGTPFVNGNNDFGWITPFLNNSRYWDTWPMFPSASYAMLGAAIGLITGTSTRPHRALLISLTITCIIGIIIATPSISPAQFFTPDQRFPIIDVGERAYKLSIWIILLLSAELVSKFIPSISRNLIARIFNLFGKQSLVAYVAHLIFLFGFWKFTPLNAYHRKQDWPAYCWMTLAVMIGTAGVCVLWQQGLRFIHKIKSQNPRSNPV